MDRSAVPIPYDFEEPELYPEPRDYLVAHLYNRGNVYHLTGQILIDAAIKHDTCCLFYRMVTMEQAQFNTIYCSFACQIPRNDQEVDIFLNVDPAALECIIDYVQTGKLVGKIQPHAIEQLASMFGMPALVQKVRDLAD